MLLCNAQIIDIHGNGLPRDMNHRTVSSIVKAQLHVHPTRRVNSSKPHYKMRAGHQPKKPVNFNKEMKQAGVVAKKSSLATFI